MVHNPLILPTPSWSSQTFVYILGISHLHTGISMLFFV